MQGRICGDQHFICKPQWLYRLLYVSLLHFTANQANVMYTILTKICIIVIYLSFHVKSTRNCKVISRILMKLGVFVVPMVLITHANFYPIHHIISGLWPQIFLSISWKMSLSWVTKSTSSLLHKFFESDY